MPLIIDTSSFRGNATAVPLLSSLSLSLSLSLKNFVSAAGLDTKYFKFLRVSKICNKSASYLINSNFNTFVILLIRVTSNKILR